MHVCHREPAVAGHHGRHTLLSTLAPSRTFTTGCRYERFWLKDTCTHSLALKAHTSNPLPRLYAWRRADKQQSARMVPTPPFENASGALWCRVCAQATARPAPSSPRASAPGGASAVCTATPPAPHGVGRTPQPSSSVASPAVSRGTASPGPPSRQHWRCMPEGGRRPRRKQWRGRSKRCRPHHQRRVHVNIKFSCVDHICVLVSVHIIACKIALVSSATPIIQESTVRAGTGTFSPKRPIS